MILSGVVQKIHIDVKSKYADKNQAANVSISAAKFGTLTLGSTEIGSHSNVTGALQPLSYQKQPVKFLTAHYSNKQRTSVSAPCTISWTSFSCDWLTFVLKCEKLKHTQLLTNTPGTNMEPTI